MKDKFKINIQLFAPDQQTTSGVKIYSSTEILDDSNLIYDGVVAYPLTVLSDGIMDNEGNKFYTYNGSNLFQGFGVVNIHEEITTKYKVGDTISSTNIKLCILTMSYSNTYTVTVSNKTNSSITFTTTGTGISINEPSINTSTSPITGLLPNEEYKLYPVYIGNSNENTYYYGDPVTVRTLLPTEYAKGGARIDVKVKNQENTFIEFGNNDITNISSISQSTQDAGDINYGVLANTGSMTIIDNDGTISQQIDDGTIDSSNLDIELYFNGNKIQEHISNDSTYDTSNLELQIPLTNNIQELDTRLYGGYIYPNTSKSLFDIFADVMSGLLSDGYIDYNYDPDTYGDNGQYRPTMGSTLYITPYKYVLDYIGISTSGMTNKQIMQSFFTNIAETIGSQTYYDGDENLYYYRENTRRFYYNICEDAGIQPDNSLSYAEMMNIAFTTFGTPLTPAYASDDYKLIIIEELLSETTLINSEEITLCDYLKSIIVEYPIIDSGRTYREVLNEICTVAQMNMYKDDKNDYKFISARPIATESDMAIVIPKSVMFEPLTYTKILKNKYDGVEINKTVVSDVINYDVVVSNYSTQTINSIFGNKVYNNESIIVAEINTAYIGYTKIEENYTSGEYSLSIKSNGNLSQIINIYNNNDKDIDGYVTVKKFGYTCNYKYSTDDIIDETQFKSDLGSYDELNNTVFINSNNYQNVNHGILSNDTTTLLPESIGGLINNTAPAYSDRYVYSNLDDKSYIKIKIQDDILYVRYSILTEVQYYYIRRKYKPQPYGPGVLTDEIYKEIKRYVAQNIEFSIYGDRREISFNSVEDRTNYFDNAKTKVTIQGGKLLQTGTKYNNTELSTIIKNNILNDYKNGISVGKTKIGAGDLYSEYNYKMKDYNNGKLLEVGDIIKVQDDDRYWRVTSREFSFDGEVLTPIQFIDVSRTYRY